MRVCILSMQAVNNYGSVLQAYALKKTLEGLGHQTFFINIQKGKDEVLNAQCQKLFYTNSTGRRTPNWVKAQLERVKNKIENLNMEFVFDRFREDYLQIKRHSDDNRYDVCVIGSDEVFNCLQASKWGFDPQLYGDVKNAKVVTTYAASCGSTRNELLSEQLRTAIAESMSNLRSISVRDENTAQFVREITGREPVYNLDPVAIGDFTEEMQKANPANKLPAHYCLVYSYKNRFSDPETINTILAYCEKHNLEPIAPYGNQSWIKKRKMLTPFELLKAFQNADCIITDTFHGALIGSKYGKNMAIVVRDSNREKLSDLTQRLKIEKHVLTDVKDLESILNIELDREQISAIMESERQKSVDYLRNCLH